MAEKKFTERAENVLRLAQEAACELGHGYVGCEHLLLAQLREENGVAYRALREAGLTEDMVRFRDGAACCVVLASGGYPTSYKSGFPITVADGFDAELYVAGAKRGGNGAMLTAGGRVLGVVSTADSLAEAVALAYRNAEYVTFEGAYKRHDIGQRALRGLRGEN